MKISTDSFLLGSWTPLFNKPTNVLDIGSGTGIVSLMIAQRNNLSLIDAIEMDKDSYDECLINVKNSPWSNKISTLHITFQKYVLENYTKKIDLIITNPPFYSENLPENYTSKHLAKFSSSLPFDKLMVGVNQLLSENGIFSLIIPFKEQNRIVELGLKNNLYPFKITTIRGNINAPFKRSLIAFSRNSELKNNYTELTIELARHKYTKEYLELTKDFYL